MAAPQPRGLMGTIMEGMAFGTGSAIAHRAVGAVAGSMFGGSDNKDQAAAPVAAAAAPAAPASTATFAGRGQDCAPFQQEFVKCLQEVRSYCDPVAGLTRRPACVLYGNMLFDVAEKFRPCCTAALVRSVSRF